MTKLVVRQARGEADTLAVADMWTASTVRLAAMGLDQWQYPIKIENLRKSVDRGDCWIAMLDRTPVATITVDDRAEPSYWPPEDQPKDAFYVHRMVTEPVVSGIGAGSALVDWAARRANRAGKAWIRLDAWRSNLALHKYYSDLGFNLVRIVEDPETGSGACFQRPSSVQLGHGPEIVVEQ